MASSSTKVRIRIPQALTLGVMASVVLMLASFSGGATRNRGGLLEVLNVGYLAYGHGRNLGMVAYWVGLFGLVAAKCLPLISSLLRPRMTRAFAASAP